MERRCRIVVAGTALFALGALPALAQDKAPPPAAAAALAPAAKLEGRIDLECGSTTNTRGRQKQVTFAYTTFGAGLKMLAKKAANVETIEDLRSKTIGRLVDGGFEI